VDAVTARVAASYRDAAGDAAFVEEMRDLARQHGDAVYQRLLATLSGLHLEPARASEHFRAILDHQRHMAERLGRAVLLLTAITDYFAQQGAVIERPRLIELAEFDRLMMRAAQDPLTGLANRRSFEDQLRQQFALAERTASSIALMFLDVDDFKSINDTHGHQVGDEVLQQVARVIRASVRDSDITARYGGEEFVILLPNTGAFNAALFAERTRTAIEQQAAGPQVTVSIGIAAYPDHAQTAEELVYNADSALYRAKGAGKNTIRLFADESRRYLRVPFREAVQIKALDFEDSTIDCGETRDIGIGGILVRNARAFELGEPVTIGIRLSEREPLLLIGQVVRVEDVGRDQFDIGIALAFKELDKLARSEIIQLLSAQRMPPAQDSTTQR
jgi:diguanylate cyclase (GGDEF)-like protein